MKKLYYVFLIIKEADDILSAKEIQNILLDEYDIDIDIKTIYQAIRNINELFDLFCGKQLILTIRRRGYCISDDYFNDGQLQYLLDSIVFNDDIANEELISLLENLSSTKQLNRLRLQDNKKQSLKFDLLLNLTNIIKAIHNNNNICFKYVGYEINNNKLKEVYRKNGNDKTDKELYVISPYKVIQRDSKYYLLGYYNLRKDKLSIYRLDRMRLVRNHKSRFIDIQEQFDFEKELDTNINMYVSGYRSDLEIRFHEDIIREIIDKIHEDYTIKKTMDHSYILETKDILISDGLIGWLMMLQEKVEVIKPIQLKEEMKNRIEKMRKIYNK